METKLATVTASNGTFSALFTLPSVQGNVNISFVAKKFAGGLERTSPTKDMTYLVDLKPGKPSFLPELTQNLDTRVVIFWTRVNEADIDHYEVFRNGNAVCLKSVLQVPIGENPSITDWALTNGYKYTYRVEAVDSRGNRSGMSYELDAKPERQGVSR